jgi:hypothetical protein
MTAHMTLEEIEDKIIDHYAREFQTDPDTLSASTDLKVRFHFNSANWAAEAAPLSVLFRVGIPQSKMNPNSTVDKLTRLIYSLMKQPAAAKSMVSSLAMSAGPAPGGASKKAKAAKAKSVKGGKRTKKSRASKKARR